VTAVRFGRSSREGVRHLHHSTWDHCAGSCSSDADGADEVSGTHRAPPGGSDFGSLCDSTPEGEIRGRWH
jgi:hypothetical protein